MFSFFPLFSSSSLCSHIDRQSYKSLIFNKSKMQLSTALRKCSESSHSSRSNERQQRIGTLRSRAPVMKGGRSSNPRREQAQGPAWSSIWASWPAACRQGPSWGLRFSPISVPFVALPESTQKRGQAVSEPTVTCKCRSSSWRAGPPAEYGQHQRAPREVTGRRQNGVRSFMLFQPVGPLKLLNLCPKK